MTVFFMALILLAVIIIVIAPIMGRGRAAEARSSGAYELDELKRRKNRLLREIKDIELDFHMGKISEEDYENLVGDYRMKAISVMKSIDAIGGRKPPMRRTMVAVPAGQEGGFCTGCGSSLFEDAKFCAACGHQVG